MHTKKWKIIQHNAKDSHQIRKEKGKRIRKKGKKYKTLSQKMNKMAISMYLSIIILKVNGLNAPIKRHRMSEWLQKIVIISPIHNPAYNGVASGLKTHKYWKWGNVKRCSMKMENEKKVRVAIFIWDIIDFKTNILTRDKQNLYNYQEINPRRNNNSKYICTNIAVAKYIQWILKVIKKEIDNSTIMWGTLTPLLHQWKNHPERLSRGKHWPWKIH